MKQFTFLAFFLFSVFVLRAQEENFKIIEKEDTLLLFQFWDDFKIALNTKDIDKLAMLIKFPFGCDRCDPLNNEAHPYAMISKKIFKAEQYQIFFKPQLIEMVNKHQMPNDIWIFTSEINNVTKNRQYVFNYIASYSPGRQEYFDLEKTNGKYKIRWAWTR